MCTFVRENSVRLSAAWMHFYIESRKSSESGARKVKIENCRNLVELKTRRRKTKMSGNHGMSISTAAERRRRAAHKKKCDLWECVCCGLFVGDSGVWPDHSGDYFGSGVR